MFFLKTATDFFNYQARNESHMYNNKSICVVVPAYKEETQIGRVIETMPDYVDNIVVVDDASPDQTKDTVKAYMASSDRIVLIEHKKNQGVGGAIVSGYKWACGHDAQVTVVMAGDGQMDPDDLPAKIETILDYHNFVLTQRFGQEPLSVPAIRPCVAAKRKAK